MGTALSAGLILKKVPFCMVASWSHLWPCPAYLKKCHHPSFSLIFLGQFHFHSHLLHLFFLGAIVSAQFGSAWFITRWSSVNHGEVNHIALKSWQFGSALLKAWNGFRLQHDFWSSKSAHTLECCSIFFILVTFGSQNDNIS